jgi:arsenate reductase (thioredoxin)
MSMDAALAHRQEKSMTKPTVLFLCTNNAVRSQMAEAFLKKRAADHFDAYSAGTQPLPSVHPLTIRVMSEVGIDLSQQRPKGLYEYLGRLPVRVAIFVCPKSEDKCPIMWPGALARLEWPFDDPAAQQGAEEEKLARFRAVRDQIDSRVTTWLTQLSGPTN